MPDELRDERDEAHAELAKERWEAHFSKHRGEKELSEHKWMSHLDQHESIARNLQEYKTQSNEWRGSLSDLRSTYAPIITHEAFEKEMRASIEALNKRIDIEREERRDSQTLRIGNAEGISRTTAIIVGALGLIGTLLGGAAVLINSFKTP